MKRCQVLLPIVCSLISIILLSPPTNLAHSSDITVLFSPTSVTGESIRDETIRRIGSTTKTLDIAIYTFSEPSLTQAILEAKKRGVSIRIILDAGQSGQKSSQVGTLRMSDLPIKLLTGIKGNGIMHHKIAIYDGQVVQAGSFNWTNNASCCSWESALYISDPEVVKRYQAAFEQMWAWNQ